MKAVKKVAATIMGISAGILMSGAAVSTDVIIDYGYGSCDTREKIFVVAVAIFLLTLYAAAVSDSFHFNNCKREQDNDKGNHLIFDRYPSRCDFQG